MNTLFKQRTEKGAFTIDFNDIKKSLKCKGVLSIEVFPKNRLDTLILNYSESDLISHDNKFVLKPYLPIVNGTLEFEPYQSKSNMESVVKFLLEE